LRRGAVTWAGQLCRAVTHAPSVITRPAPPPPPPCPCRPQEWFQSRYEWDLLAVRGLWAFGPDVQVRGQQRLAGEWASAGQGTQPTGPLLRVCSMASILAQLSLFLVKGLRQHTPLQRVSVCSGSITRLRARATGHGQTRPQTQPVHRAGRQLCAGCRTALPPRREAAARAPSGEATQAGLRTPEQRTPGEETNSACQKRAPTTQGKQNAALKAPYGRHLLHPANWPKAQQAASPLHAKLQQRRRVSLYMYVPLPHATAQGPNVLLDDSLAAETDKGLLSAVRDSIIQARLAPHRHDPHANTNTHERE
jgi:hypothetical protein